MRFCRLKTESSCFKENALYKVKLKSGNALNTGSLLADDDSVFYDSDTFSQAKQADIGCVNSRVCVLCGSYPSGFRETEKSIP